MKNLLIFPVLFVALMFFMTGCEKTTTPVDSLESFSPNVEAECDIFTCAATPGYWKNHPEAWLSTKIRIGIQQPFLYYPKDVAIPLMGAPEKGDKTITLFRAVAATQLNLERGSDPSCIINTYMDAMEWLVLYPVGTKVNANSPAWKIGEPLYLELDKYNNGFLCAPGCD